MNEILIEVYKIYVFGSGKRILCIDVFIFVLFYFISVILFVRDTCLGSMDHSLAKHVSRKLGFLSKAREFFLSSHLLTIYKSQIRPSLEY